MRLGLFPLTGTVLFPGMQVPLRVFEPRYRELVTECLAADRPFGIALIREGREVGEAAIPHDVGTTARLELVTPTADGDLAIRVRGEQRFRIRELIHDRAFLSATVELPVDESAAVPEALVSQAEAGLRQLYRLRDTVDALYRRDVGLPRGPGALADAIGASAAGAAPPAELQALLATLNVRRRVELALDVLGGLLDHAHRETRLAVARRWGAIEKRN